MEKTDSFNTVEDFKRAFRRTASGLRALQAVHQERERHRARRFNIFRLLGVHTREVKTHSALLAELLDPQGSHGQGALFLTSFLELCEEAKPVNGAGDFPDLDLADAYSHAWRIETEKATATGGFLDIVVRCHAASFVLVIENKIATGDQHKQIERYRKWLDRRASPERRALVYLTPDGRKAESAGGSAYRRLSYREDIRRWLRNTLTDVQAPRVRSVLRQYLQVIASL